jgi:site-specific recombinase XerD
MTANSIEGDYTQADTATLNHFFREYYRANGQGGTHTLQRNLIQLFNYLEHEHAHAIPYKTGLNRYADVKGRPKTLSADFIDELLDVTGGGKARDFETARDHAIIRILCGEGIRRQELLGMVMYAMPADLIRNPVFRLVPLKGSRAAGEGRLAALSPSGARATHPLPARPARPQAGRFGLGLARHPRTRQAREHRDPQDARPQG